MSVSPFNCRRPDERRWKCVRVRAEMVARVFDVVTRPVDWIQVPRFADLPPGYEVIHVCHDDLRGGFVFILSHASWPALGENEQAPFIDCVVDAINMPRIPAP